MPIAEVTVLPMGAGTSASEAVARAVSVLEEMGLRYVLTPMSTVFEAESMETLLEAVRRMHEAAFLPGVGRVETIVKIDDRRDKEIDMDYKVKVVKEKLRKIGTRPTG